MNQSRSQTSPLVISVFVFLIVTAVFAKLARCGFTYWDDADTIAANPRLNPPTLSAVKFYWTTVGERTPGQLFTPVTYTVWAGAAAVSDVMFGRTADVDGIRLVPAVFHATNVLLHATSAVLVLTLLRRLFGRPWPAAAGALLFALHPVQVEPVAWASGTKDVLCGLFAIAALSTHVVWCDRRRRLSPATPGSEVRRRPRSSAYLRPRRARSLYLFATSLFLLAMLSKPTAIVVPLMAAAIDLLLLGRTWRAVARSLWPWALLMIPCALWTRAAQSAPWASPIALWQRPLVATDAVAFYLCKLAWPAHLCVDYGRRPGDVVASGVAYYSWLLPAAVFAGAIVWTRTRSEPSGFAAGSSAGSSASSASPSPAERRTRGGAAGLRRSPPLAALALFALPLFPVLGLVPFDFQFYSTVADHYLYLPMLGVAVAATWGLTRVPAQQHRLASLATAAVLVALGVRSSVQMPTWQTTTTLFEHTLAVNPRSFAACDQLGHVEVVLARRIAGQRPTVPPSDPRYDQWRGDIERSLVWYRQALRLFDGYVPALVNIATNAGRLGRGDEQRQALRRVYELQPTVPVGLRADPLELANRMLAAGDPAAAVRVLDDLLRADPTNVAAMVLRSRAMATPSN